MPIFKYEAVDSQGVPVKDEIEALSEKEAASKIRNMGYYVAKVQPKTSTKKAASRPTRARKRKGTGTKAKVKHVTQFARQLSTLQDAGLPILRSLRILEEQQKGPLKKVIGYTADEIEGGSTLSEALGKFPRCFDRLFVGMVSAGESGGVLELILSRIADFMEKSQKLKAKVKSAMVYPAVVITFAFLLLIALMKFVIPSFQEVLGEMLDGEEMNPVTTNVMNASQWIAEEWGWAYLVATPIVMIFVLKIIRKARIGRLVLDSIKLRLPIIGPLSNKISVTRWARTLGTLIGAGVPILDAINVTKETTGNEVISNMLGDVHDSIRQGDSFAGPLKSSRVVDGIIGNMVSVGEETGDLDKMLLKVADNYDEQVDVMVNGMMSLLEPIMIIVLGGIVMTIVLSVFLPMIQIISALGN